MAGQGTGPINPYEVLRDRINEFRSDIKELRQAIGQRTKQGECNRLHDEIGKRMDQFRQELSTIEGDLSDRIEVVEGTIREAQAMTNEVVRAAVAQELKSANGHMKDAVVEELRKANGHGFWPKTFNDWLKTAAVVVALVGVGYTWLDGYGEKRVAEQKQQETIEQMKLIVNQLAKQQQPPATP